MTDRPKTRAELLEEIQEDLCDNYCKHPQEYIKIYGDPDKAYEAMLEDKCKNCPSLKIGDLV